MKYSHKMQAQSAGTDRHHKYKGTCIQLKFAAQDCPGLVGNQRWILLSGFTLLT